ncbi:LytTR family DNA-binding domain-containing protein [uncultured Bifidobacterium sp.]|uniref:LytTR family DNA-binding domain-containing protein n=1 Tax=uncultured Bifidobacterium sp. TaxID=165187 RepID=UPI0028DB100F|nr:LytTR family DNA-binding domain-containing protein [uncultured Bifidobacterium sp.]
MTVSFRRNPNLPKGRIDIIVESSEPSAESDRVLNAIAAMGRDPATVVIESAGRLEVLRRASIVSIEVRGDVLVIRTTEGRTIAVRDRLYRLLERLADPDIVQVSRQTAIAVRHLVSLEASYSGNMTALLDSGATTTVSRRYVPALRRVLGV